MKKHYSLVKGLFFIVSALLVFQIIILSMKIDLRRIITTAIVVIGFIATFIIMLILRKEASKIIYEYEDEDGNNPLVIRLLDYDDYQHVRVLLCDKPISNSQEEVEILKEYDKITVDLIRTHYHYIVFDKETPIAIFHVSSEGKKDTISYLSSINNSNKEIIDFLKETAVKNDRDLSDEKKDIKTTISNSEDNNQKITDFLKEKANNNDREINID